MGSDKKTCEFESLFATEVKSRSDEPPPVLFHRVAELWSQAQLRCQSIAEPGRLPSLPARKRSLPLAQKKDCAMLRRLTLIFCDLWVVYPLRGL